MKIVSSRETWKGHFTYEVGYDENNQYLEVPFSMQIVVENDAFFGTSVDEESKHLFDTPTGVTGFFGDNTISFVLKYPYSYYRDEDGTLVAEKNMAHPDVHYYGAYDEVTKTYSGRWEITYEVEERIDGDVQEVFWGYWELRRG
ncbi:MAG: hypothetical protein KTR22_04790 [Flavobacteriaceae bacterium]|nr:hypothetical protein [Flavobacteriaceae bacterium]